jgi:hypothetical protein
MAEAFLPSVLKAPDRGGFTEEEAAYLSLQLIIGAADTVGHDTISRNFELNSHSHTTNYQSQISTWSFLEAMLQYPDVQQKARAEIGMVKTTPPWDIG